MMSLLCLIVSGFTLDDGQTRREICKIANFNMIIALNFAHDPSRPTNPRKIRAQQGNNARKRTSATHGWSRDQW